MPPAFVTATSFFATGNKRTCIKTSYPCRTFTHCRLRRCVPIAVADPEVSADSEERPSFPTFSSQRPPTPLPPNAVAVAEAAADAAGEILRSHFRQPLPVDFKGDDSPVTQADREVEAAIRAIISKQFPDHAIIGEELGGVDSLDELASKPGIVWVIDPLDGTRAFVCGRPTFATLIAIVVDGFAVVGIIDQPISRERWVGRPDGPTTLNGVPVHVRPRGSLADSIVQATTPEMFVGIDALAFRRVSRAARNVVFGGDCYAYAQVASGCADVVVEADLKPWDYLALVPVVEGAGGIMSDWMGDHLCLGSDGRAIASASEGVHEEVIELLGVRSAEFGLDGEDDDENEDLKEAEKAAHAQGRELDEEEKEAARAINQASRDVLPEDPGPGFVESMTGFGAAEARSGGYVVGVEARSVNNRFCDVQIRGSGVLQPYEGELIALVKRLARRGRINIFLDINREHLDESTNNNETSSEENEVDSSDSTPKLAVIVDKPAVREVRDLLRSVADEAGVDNFTVADVMRFSEVLVRPDTGIVAKELLPVAKRAVAKAMMDLRKARRREGALLEEDMMARTRNIKLIAEDIGKRAGNRVQEERARLTKLIDGLLERQLADTRVEAEVTLFADKVDFSEEVVRLRAHVQMFELAFLGVDEPIGARLSFILQEMLREANTLAAKAANAPVAHLTVVIKEEIEKLREQTANIN